VQMLRLEGELGLCFEGAVCARERRGSWLCEALRGGQELCWLTIAGRVVCEAVDVGGGNGEKVVRGRVFRDCLARCDLATSELPSFIKSVESQLLIYGQSSWS
jgi:hypothetical protein